MQKIPVSVVVMTKNEERNIAKVPEGAGRVRRSLRHRLAAPTRRARWPPRWARRWWTSSGTASIRRKQWCLEQLPFSHPVVLYVDADEEMTPALASAPACRASRPAPAAPCPSTLRVLRPQAATRPPRLTGWRCWPRPLRLGFLDGKAGFDYAVARAMYYWQIRIRIKTEEIRKARQACRGWRRQGGGGSGEMIPARRFHAGPARGRMSRMRRMRRMSGHASETRLARCSGWTCSHWRPASAAARADGAALVAGPGFPVPLVAAVRLWVPALAAAAVRRARRRQALIRPSATVTYPWKVDIGEHAWIGDDAVIYWGRCTSARTPWCRSAATFAPPTMTRTNPTSRCASARCASRTAPGSPPTCSSPGVTVGREAVVGARSSVFRDLPPAMICHGTPCRPCVRADGSAHEDPDLRHQLRPRTDRHRQVQRGDGRMAGRPRTQRQRGHGAALLSAMAGA